MDNMNKSYEISTDLVIENHSQLNLDEWYVHQTADFFSDKTNDLLIKKSEVALEIWKSIKVEKIQFETVYVTALQKKNRMEGAPTLAFTTAFPLQLKPGRNRILVFDNDNPFPFRFFEAKGDYEEYDYDGCDTDTDTDDW